MWRSEERSSPASASSSSASIVGTKTAWVMRSRAIVSSTARGLEARQQHMVPPTQVAAKTFEVPATWNIGHTCNQRSSHEWPVTARLCMALASRLRWLSITPLGVPVVPPV